MTSSSIDDCLDLVRGGKAYLENCRGATTWQFGDMWLFSQAEYDNLKKLEKLICNYVDGGVQKKPLCICVFGPPGSGKSFAVKQIYKQIQNVIQGTTSKELIWETFNLTQALSPDLLTNQIKKFLNTKGYDSNKNQENADDAKIPFLFVDEFDAPLDGSPLGWLHWFLAPMQDGEIGVGESQILTNKAVYIFAGGTAETFSEFSGNKSLEFKEAKGPDFVSRLQSFLDVRGINFFENRGMRRAFMIHNILHRHGENAPKLPDILTEKLLNQGRYIHGARSIETILNVAIRAYESEGSGSGSLKEAHFDSKESQSIHLDDGPLDAKNMNGLVGLSVGKGLQIENSDGQDFVLQLIKRLWSLGATIAYGGKWDTNLTSDISAESDNVISTITRQKKVCIFLRGDRNHIPEEVDGIEWVSTKSYLDTSPVIPSDTFLKKSLAGFKMRWLMSTRCASRILIGGKLQNYSGRMPGVIEEAMLAMALKQPIYVVGKYGDASKVIGEQIGLSDATTHNAVEQLSFFEEKMDILTSCKEYFLPKGIGELPLTTTHALSYIKDYSIGGPNWVDNGLTPDENRQLFNSDDDNEIIGLICTGLMKKFQ